MAEISYALPTTTTWLFFCT